MPDLPTRSPLAAAPAGGRRTSAGISPGDGEQAPLDSEQLAAVRRIALRARRLATQFVSGDYRSVFRGTGMEFAEVREYIPGDDVRFIDWNVTARLGAPWVKEYVEERELAVLCAVDLSASQDAAAPGSGRLGTAAEVVALISFAALFNNDRAGLMTFTDRVERFVAPAKGSRHVLRIVREIVQPAPRAAGTDIGAACEHLSRVLTRRSVVVLLSDFLASGYERSLAALSRRHEVIAVTLTDALDLALPEIGIVEVEDAERGDRILLDTGDARVRHRYAEAASERAAARRRALVAAGVDEIELRVGEAVVGPLVAYFRRRAMAR